MPLYPANYWKYDGFVVGQRLVNQEFKDKPSTVNQRKT
jgi:hypothetical protein